MSDRTTAQRTSSLIGMAGSHSPGAQRLRIRANLPRRRRVTVSSFTLIELLAAASSARALRDPAY